MGWPADMAERLRAARKSAGFKSAAAFARSHALHVTTYQHHENGNRALTPPVAERYAALLRVDPGWLMFGRDKPTPAPNHKRDRS